MHNLIFHCPDLNTDDDIATITRKILDLRGVEQVEVDSSKKEIKVKFQYPTTMNKLLLCLTRAHFVAEHTKLLPDDDD